MFRSQLTSFHNANNIPSPAYSTQDLEVYMDELEVHMQSLEVELDGMPPVIERDVVGRFLQLL
jgi:hypothetical protein